MDVAAALDAVRERVARASTRSGRGPDAVRLVAVSKRHPPEAIRAARAAGQRDFGENYAQELRDKAAALADLDVAWHAIGPLQTNKVKYVAAVAAEFHALDRLAVAEALAARVATSRPGFVLRCFVEVNVAGDATKHGVTPAGLPELLAGVAELPALRVVGLMTLPDPATAPAAYRALAALADRHRLAELSMGTTDDFEAAIAAGATTVRVGRSIFGERPV